jgi:hypothetical protein
MSAIGGKADIAANLLEDRSTLGVSHDMENENSPLSWLGLAQGCYRLLSLRWPACHPSLTCAWGQ